MSLYERPAQFDWVELGRIRCLVEQPTAGFLDQLPYFGRVVRPEIVHHDDCARGQPRNENLADEIDEPVPVHCTWHRAVTNHTTESDGPDHSEVSAPVDWLQSVDATAHRCTPIARRHGDVAARFVDKNQVCGVYPCDFVEEDLALVLDVGPCLLGGAERLFFRESPARASARCTLERVVVPP